MRTTLTILQNSLRLTMQELLVNKLRTSLSLIGISFGIFCIIGVLATVNSLEKNIQNQIQSLGSNTVYIDKWEYSGKADYPFWKYAKRPIPKYEEAAFIKQRSQLVTHASYSIHSIGNVEFKNSVLQGVTVYGITEEQINIQPIVIVAGRYFSTLEFISGNVLIMGFENATNLFGNAEDAPGKEITLKNKKIKIIGVIKKEGKNLIGWNYDNCVMIPYKCCKQIFDEKHSDPFIMVTSNDAVSSDALKDELEGVMRSVRKLTPKQDDNFSLNDVNGFSNQVSNIFGNINIGGWAIGLLSLVVGAFGIANIMFVTVKERTAMIGLKKAIGAKRVSILLEFLMEAAIICIMGGLIGLFLVYILTIILTNIFNFPVFISAGILSLAILLCITIGILAGLIPALIAARLDPVVAIRS